MFAYFLVKLSRTEFASSKLNLFMFIAIRANPAYLFSFIVHRNQVLKQPYPFNTQEDTGVPFHWNFNSILRRDHEKISYERRAYESVDEKTKY